MRSTRRSAEHARRQTGRRTASQIIRIEAPVGGWNTRDSEDNISPTDAIEFDNWWADIGEVRTRPGYSLFKSTSDIEGAVDFISNGGFETPGAGAPDVFDDWQELITSVGTVEESAYKHSGSKACALIKNTFGGSALVRQTTTGLTAETWYKLKFWDTAYSETFTDNRSSIMYSLYDVTNGAYIVEDEETGHLTEYGRTPSYEESEVVFKTPASCTSVQVIFSTGDRTSVYYILDDVSMVEISVEPSSIETLAEYISGTDRDLIAIGGGESFDMTPTTPVHLSSSIATFTNSRFQWANFNGHLVLVNGAEQFEWDGTTFQSFSAAGVALSGGIGDPIGCNVFKNRMWYWEQDSQDAWYTALYAHGGACTQFPLSRVGQFGGNLILMETWTRDGGSGPDDFAVFVMSSGEAIVYQGSYPGSSGDWALVGIYNIGEPIGYRAAVKFGGDLYIITNLDIVRMSEVLQGAEARSMETKISTANRTAVSLYSDNWGWEASVYPSGHMAIFNIPVVENEEMEQHVRNTLTGAWSRFKGIVANTWQLFDGDMYIGSSDGKVYKFNDGDTDYEDPIESTFQTAWLPVGGVGASKLFKAVRESYKTSADIIVSNMFATDFRAFSAQQFPVAVDDAGALWDVSPWDTTPWNSGDTIYNEWESIGAFGERVSMRKRLNTKQKVVLLGYDWLVEIGGRL